MVKIERPVPANNNGYLLLAVKLLLIAVIILLLPRLVEARKSAASKRRRLFEAKLRQNRIACERHEACRHLYPEERVNCVNGCLSSLCYRETYGEISLEDGEIDLKRAKEFESCVLEELRVRRSKEKLEAQQERAKMRQQKRESKSGFFF